MSADHVFRLGPIQSWPFCKKLPEQFYYFSTFSPLKNRPKTCPHHQSSEAFSLKNLWLTTFNVDGVIVPKPTTIQNNSMFILPTTTLVASLPITCALLATGVAAPLSLSSGTILLAIFECTYRWNVWFEFLVFFLKIDFFFLLRSNPLTYDVIKHLLTYCSLPLSLLL